MNSKALQNLALIAVLCLSAVLFHAKSDQVHMKAFDSAVHARIALNVTENFPNSLKPNLPIPNPLDQDHPAFNDHPFPLFYLAGISSRLFGVSLQSLRFIPGLLFPLLCIFWVFRLGCWIGNGRFMSGFLSALILALSPYFIRGGNGFQLEPAQAFFILLTFEALFKRKLIKGGFFTAIGIWIKHPVSLLPYAAVGTEELHQLLKKKVKNVRYLTQLILSGTLALILGLGIWWITDRIAGDNHLSLDYFNRQFFGTTVQGRGQSYQFGFLFFLKLLVIKWEPWFLVLLATGFIYSKPILRKRIFFTEPIQSSALRSITFGAVIIYVLISLIAFRYEHYYYPIYPLLALVVGVSWSQWVEKYQTKFLSVIIALTLIFMTYFLSSGLHLSVERYPELRGLMPYFQKFGNCKKEFWVIEGPYSRGGAQEHRIEVALHAAYIRTKVLNTNSFLEEWNNKSSDFKPEWILVPEKTYTEDFTGPIKEKMELLKPIQIRSGNLTAFYFGTHWDSSYRFSPSESLKIIKDCHD